LAQGYRSGSDFEVMSNNKPATQAHWDGAVYNEKDDGTWTLKPPPSLEERQSYYAMLFFIALIPILVFVSLMSSLPARRWAHIKHPAWEGRHEVSIGAWGACSEDFKSDVAWATAPWYSHCTQTLLDSCFAAAMPACTNSSDPDYYTFADNDGANEKYEAAWTNCRVKCSTRKWEDRCLALGCQGAKHSQQCWDVTLVEKGFSNTKLMYKPRSSSSPGLAWSKSDNDCRPISDICDNDTTLAHVGNFGVAGCVFTGIGVGMLLVFMVKIKTLPVFAASFGTFFLSWLLVLISWSVFAAELQKEVTCAVVDSVAWGCGLSADSSSMCAVSAKGDYGALVDPGTTFGVVVGCWILLTILLILLIIWLMFLLKKPEPETSQI